MTSARAYSFAGGTMTVLVAGEQTGGAFTVLHMVKAPGSSTPPHSHDTEVELVYVLAGELGVEMNSTRVRRRAGELVVLPPGQPHRLFNDTSAPVRELLVCSPAIFDRFVAAVGTEVLPGAAPRPMSEQDKQRLVKAAPDYGIRLLRSTESTGSTAPTVEPAQEALDVMGARVEVLARLGDADDALVLLRETVHPGRAVSLHSHADPECFFVTAGVLDLYREDKGWLKLEAEQFEHVGRDIRHAVRNGGTEPVELVMVTTVRMARFFSDIGSPATEVEPRRPNAMQLAAFLGHVTDYGYWVAPPEENLAIGLDLGRPVSDL
jgi:quercetin dioxygenase-like cupin family protein